MQDNYLYIEYEIGEKDRFIRFKTIFQKIKEEKEKYCESGEDPSTARSEWENFLDDEAKKWFDTILLAPNSEEIKTYDKLWLLTASKVRLKHPMFNTGENWDFESMLTVLFESDYELIKLEESDNKGRLYYNPGGFPFGGTDALVQLIESFGNEVVYDEWHKGPHLRQAVGWDFELAKQLVAQNKGVEMPDDEKLTTKNNKTSPKKPKWKFWK